MLNPSVKTLGRTRSLETQRHKQAVWIFAVASKRPTVGEAIALVQPLGRIERCSRTCFKAEALIATRPGNLNEVFEDGTTNTFPTVSTRCSHGFDLTLP